MKKKLLCVVLVVVMCLSVASVAMAAGESPAEGWLTYDPTTVPEGYKGYTEPNPDVVKDVINDYVTDKYPDATFTEIGLIGFVNEAGEVYEGGASIGVEDASVAEGDKVIVICVNIATGEVVEVEATSYDGGFSFTAPYTPGGFSYTVIKVDSSANVTDSTTNKTTTSAKSPKTGGEDR